MSLCDNTLGLINAKPAYNKVLEAFVTYFASSHLEILWYTNVSDNFTQYNTKFICLIQDHPFESGAQLNAAANYIQQLHYIHQTTLSQIFPIISR